MDTELAQLRAFVVLAEELHFGRAARRLHLSQPGLSRRIRRLEQRMGVALVARDPSGVTLTPPGHDLLLQARHAVDSVEAALGLVARHESAARRHLRVGFTGTAASDVLPPTLRELRAGHPHLEVEVRELTSRRYEALHDDELDAVFGRIRPGEIAGLEVRVLREEPRVVALAATHPLAARPRLRLAQLRDEPFVTQPQRLNPTYRAQWLAEQRAHGLEARIAAEPTSTTEALNLVAAGVGACLAPSTASRYHARPDVVYVPVADVRPTTLSIARVAGPASPQLLALVDAATHATALLDPSAARA